MTQTLSADGKAIYFPTRLFEVDGVIAPSPEAELEAIARSVDANEALLFTKRLIDAARKRRRQPRYAAINTQRLELARQLIDRMLADERPAIAQAA